LPWLQLVQARRWRRRFHWRIRLLPPTPFLSPMEMPRLQETTTRQDLVSLLGFTSPSQASSLDVTLSPICSRSLVSPSNSQWSVPTTSSTSFSSPMVMESVMVVSVLDASSAMISMTTSTCPRAKPQWPQLMTMKSLNIQRMLSASSDLRNGRKWIAMFLLLES